ncbi:hypothetical protein EDB83DRAFT_2552313 [Lactarius deliciosus]|nr:hypothetical protein EDB83DRAFT_2552313 [Lactarius deliciosus]
MSEFEILELNCGTRKAKETSVDPNEKPALLNGSPRPFGDMSVSEIKERAIQQAQRASRGSSAISLIRSAKGQISLAQSCESAGDLKGALSAFTRAAESVPGKRGVLWKEFTEFQQREGSDFMQRAHAIESRLSQVESPAATQLNEHHPSPALENGVQKASRGTIADRMRSLQDAGLSVSTTTKRVSREIPSTLSIPLSPTSTSSDSTRTIRNSLQSLGLSSPTISHSTSSSSKVSSPPPPVYSFVEPSAIGPPSPTSSASSSPRTSFLTLEEFSQAFPSIDELEEIDGRRAVADVEPCSDTSGSPDSKSTPRSGGTRPPGDHSPNIGTGSFPFLPVDLGTCPSSTPITPVVDHFASWPASPVERTLGIRGSSSPFMPSAELHVKNMVGPRELHDYMYRQELKVLMLDVRTREAFGYEHIRGDAVVCIEPSVLLRNYVSGQTIEDSLIVAPRDEWVLFCNRDKFDLIAIYDDASETPGPPDAPLSRLERAIYETAFRKILKRVPVLLIGGLEAWKHEFGERELVVAEALGSGVRLRHKSGHVPAAARNIDHKGARSPRLTGNPLGLRTPTLAMAPKRYLPSKSGMTSTSSKTSDKEELLNARALKRAERVKARYEEAEKRKDIGNALFRKGKYPMAIEEYEAAIKTHGPSAVYLSNMAAAWLKLEAYDVAEHCAQRALVMDPTFMKARYRRGLARKGSFQLYAAMLDFEALLEQDPDSTEAKKALDETLTLMNERDEDDESVAFDQEFPSLSEKKVELESASDSSDWNHEGNGIPCRFYNHDGCMRGTGCRFSHAPDHKSVRDRLGRNVCMHFSTRGLQIWQQRVCIFSRQDLLALRPLVG